MLAIRMQRTGRKGHAHFRVVVQDSRQTPTSGKFVALVGNYDPHTKTANLVKDKIEFYIKHGAQPSDRAALLFKKEGIKLPNWVSVDTKKQAKLRNPEKLRKNQPKDAVKTEAPQAEPAVEAKAEAPEVAAEAAASETQAAASPEAEVAAEPPAEDESAPAEAAPEVETVETAETPAE